MTDCIHYSKRKATVYYCNYYARVNCFDCGCSGCSHLEILPEDSLHSKEKVIKK